MDGEYDRLVPDYDGYTKRKVDLDKEDTAEKFDKIPH